MLGFVLERVRAHRLLVAAALLSVLLATAVLAALTAFSSTLGDAGLRHALEHRSVARTVLDVHSDVSGTDRRRADKEIRRAAEGAFDGLPVSVASSTSSGPYALPAELRRDRAPKGGTSGSGTSEGDGGKGGDEPDLTTFASLDRAQVRMVKGTWPQVTREGRTVQVAIPQAVAQRLKLRPGDTFRTTSRLSGPPPLEARVTGVYAPKSPRSPYWRLDPLRGEGVTVLDFTTYGPLAVPEGSFTHNGRTAQPASGASEKAPLWPEETRWQARADFSGVGVSRIPALRDQAERTVKRIGDASHATEATASTELPRLLDSLERSLLVTRSTLLIAGLQLALLTGFALLLVARLLVAERAEETALLRARGASRARVCALAVGEALLLAVPAAALTPLLAGPAVRQLTGYGPLATAGIGPVSGVPAGSWTAAAATALGCALMVALPTLRQRGGAGDADPENGGGEAPRPVPRKRRTAVTVLRSGADLALAALAVIAYWQLQRRSQGTGVLSGDSSDGVGGALGIDPVLVAAPALALLAGTLLTLRLLPLVARVAERRAGRGKGLTAALAGWHLSRRPLRGAAPALLLVLALATGVFAVGQGASWDRSQGDQADFRTGADIAVSGATASGLTEGGRYDRIDGISAVAPVARTSFSVDGGRTAQVIATDTRNAADGVLRLRDDQADEPLPGLLRPLAPRAGAPGLDVRLPRDARELSLRVRLEGPKGKPADTRESLALTVEDRFGVPYTFLLGDVPADGEAHTLEARFATGENAPAGPLRLTRLDLSYVAPTKTEPRTLTVESLQAGERTVRPARAGATPPRMRADDPQGSLGRGSYAAPEPGTVRTRTEGAPLTLRYTTGSAPAPVGNDDPVPVALEMGANSASGGGGSDADAASGSAVSEGTASGGAGSEGATASGGAGSEGTASEGAGSDQVSKASTGPAARPLPAVATDAYLRASGAKVGDTVKAQISGEDLTVRVTGAVRALPTEPTGREAGPDTAGALLVDLAALDRVLTDLDGTPLEPRDWWLATERGATARVAEALRAEPGIGTVRVRDETAGTLREDPLGAGPRVALTAIALAAAVLAATGFAVSTAGAARERSGEFAVLRALGASRVRLARALAAEQGLLLLLATAVGLGLGVLLTRLVVPLIVLTPEATLPVPELLVRLPLGPLALLVAAVLAVPVAAIAGTALRRTDPVTALRTERGE